VEGRRAGRIPRVAPDVPSFDPGGGGVGGGWLRWSRDGSREVRACGWNEGDWAGGEYFVGRVGSRAQLLHCVQWANEKSQDGPRPTLSTLYDAICPLTLLVVFPQILLTRRRGAEASATAVRRPEFKPTD
jgi:hypothetical protein